VAALTLGYISISKPPERLFSSNLQIQGAVPHPGVEIRLVRARVAVLRAAEQYRRIRCRRGKLQLILYLGK
jgi:hypothetical protein